MRDNPSMPGKLFCGCLGDGKNKHPATVSREAQLECRAAAPAPPPWAEEEALHKVHPPCQAVLPEAARNSVTVPWRGAEGADLPRGTVKAPPANLHNSPRHSNPSNPAQEQDHGTQCHRLGWLQR